MVEASALGSGGRDHARAGRHLGGRRQLAHGDGNVTARLNTVSELAIDRYLQFETVPRLTQVRRVCRRDSSAGLGDAARRQP